MVKHTIILSLSNIKCVPIPGIYQPIYVVSYFFAYIIAKTFYFAVHDITLYGIYVYISANYSSAACFSVSPVRRYTVHSSMGTASIPLV